MATLSSTTWITTTALTALTEEHGDQGGGQDTTVQLHSTSPDVQSYQSALAAALIHYPISLDISAFALVCSAAVIFL